jgi:hypothetical protein
LENRSILSALDAEIARLQDARKLLAALNGKGKAGKLTGAGTKKRSKRKLSAEARAKISAAQKLRWAAVRKASK